VRRGAASCRASGGRGIAVRHVTPFPVASGVLCGAHVQRGSSGKLPGTDRGRDFWQDRYDDINAFERHLTRNGTLVLKFFLNVSKKQRGSASWSGSSARRRTGSSRSAISRSASLVGVPAGVRADGAEYEHEMGAVVVHPRRSQEVTRTLLAAIITRSIDGLGVAFPKVSDTDRLRLAAARTELLADK
jgi:hypothetical protein